jgi:HlyD family secretion protein
MNETLHAWIAQAEELWRILQGIIASRPDQAFAYAGGAFVLLLVIYLLVRRPLRADGDRSLARETRSARLAGYTLALTFFGGFGYWAATASLSGAAMAVGVISPDGARKTVQHLEGGIIRQIHVREGDSVHTGQPLVTLQDTQALARFEELHERRIYLLALEARLVAEQLGAAEIDFDAELLADQSEAARDAVASQTALFSRRLAVQEGRARILGQRIAQIDEEISGLTEVIAAEDAQIALITEELANVTALLEKGLTSQPRVMALQREQAELTGSRASNRASIARNRQAIGETELQLLTIRQQFQEEASKTLTEVRAELSAIESQLLERSDILLRTTIFAPTDGMVMNIRVTTENSGVIGPGEPILDIVPDDALLVVDARVRPQDVDQVTVDMRARIVLSAFNQRYLPQLFGTVRSISADRLVDERTGEPYFLAKIAVEPAEIAALADDIELVAGMPAEVMILTGERTFLDLMLRPVSSSIRRSFRDDS